MIESFDGVWGVLKIISRFPGAFSDGKAFPLDQVVEFAPSASCLCLEDFFYFVLLFSINDIRGWLDKVCVMIDLLLLVVGHWVSLGEFKRQQITMRRA